MASNREEGLMEQLHERLMPKIKIAASKLFWILGIFILLTLVLRDLANPGGGYLNWIFTCTFSLLMSSYNDAVEIAQTPLASLTIAKIFTFIWYCFIAWLIYMFGYGLWSAISEKLEDQQNKRFEEEREREKKEESYSAESHKECSACIFEMENTENLSDLNSLFYQAIGKWPKWEKQLSRIYKARKRWLEKITPV